jgi:hypothetical protein
MYNTKHRKKKSIVAMSPLGLATFPSTRLRFFSRRYSVSTGKPRSPAATARSRVLPGAAEVDGVVAEARRDVDMAAIDGGAPAVHGALDAVVAVGEAAHVVLVVVRSYR